jgi:CHAD domain-containing protein
MGLDPEQVQKPVRRIRKLLKKLPKQPAPQDVHDLRASSRRFEATVSALALDKKRRGRRTLRVVDRVRKRAGKVRDMDVLIHLASTLHVDKEDECSIRLLEHLGQRRRKAAKALHSVVTKRRARARSGLKKLSRRFERLSAQGFDAMRATAAALRLESALNEPAKLGRENLHPYRLKLKDLRNTLRLAEHPDPALLGALSEVKNAIGRWHDWEQLLTEAKGVLDHSPRCMLVRELHRICDEQYDEALRAALRLRRTWLKEKVGAVVRLS